jgi:hypothetical protein
MAFERIRPTKQQLERFSLPPAFGGSDVNFDNNTDRTIEPLLIKAQRVMDGIDSFSFDDLQRAIATLIVGKD